MSLGNIGGQTAPTSWLNKGWSSLRDSAHSAITHFKHDEEAPETSDVSEAPAIGSWGILAADLIEHNDTVEAVFEIPGMSKEDLNIEIHGGQIVVSGEKRMSSSREKGGVLITERAFGFFRRSLPVPGGVDPEQASASYADGVLIISMPKGSTPVRANVPIH